MLLLNWFPLHASSCSPDISVSLSQVSVDEKTSQYLAEQVMTALETADLLQTLIQTCNQTNSIRLTNELNPNHTSLVSNYTLAGVPSFALYTTESTTKTANIIVQRNRPFQLNYGRNTYFVDDDVRITGLLKDKKVDGVIDYKANSPIYRRHIPTIELFTLSEPAPIYIEFENFELLQHFELGVTKLLEQDKNAPFKQRVRVRQNKTQIDWLILNKYFSAEKDALVALDEELDIANWLNNKLANYQLNISSTSKADAIEKVKNQDNACLAGVLKNAEREQYSLFSDTYIYYLLPRIYVVKGSVFHEQLKTFIDDTGAVDIVNALKTLRRSTLGFSPSTVQAFKELKTLLESNSGRFVNIEAFERHRMLQLLEKGRIDSLIEFPTNIKQLVNSDTDITKFTSIEISPHRAPLPTYTACSKSELGAEFIDAIYELLAQPETKLEYIELITQGLTDSSTVDVHKAAGTFDLWQALSNK